MANWILGEWTPQKVGVSAILLSKTLSHFTNRIRHENNPTRNKFTEKRTILQHTPLYACMQWKGWWSTLWTSTKIYSILLISLPVNWIVPGKLGPGQLGPGARLSRAQLLGAQFAWSRTEYYSVNSDLVLIWFQIGLAYTGCFFNWYPPKKLKYVKPKLGESTLT